MILIIPYFLGLEQGLGMQYCDPIQTNAIALHAIKLSRTTDLRLPLLHGLHRA